MHHSTHYLRHIRTIIGHNIHQARNRQHRTLSALADETGLPAELLDRYELSRNDITLPQMVRIACALNVRTEHLFKGADAD